MERNYTIANCGGLRLGDSLYTNPKDKTLNVNSAHLYHPGAQNVLVNADFRMPVNTGGKTTWENADRETFIDGWLKNTHVKCVLDGNGLTCTPEDGHDGYITQKIPKTYPKRLNGETLCASLFIKDVGMDSGSFVYLETHSDSITAFENDYVRIVEGSDKQIYVHVKKECTISAVKVEVGEFPTIMYDAPENPEITKIKLAAIPE